MFAFVPNKVYLRGILLNYCIQNKSADEAHRILVETYGDNALSDTTCRDWFRRFKNMILNLRIKNVLAQRKNVKTTNEDRSPQAPAELGKTLQVGESTVSKRLKVLGKIQKQGQWVPYELKPRDVEQRFVTCELLLQRQKRNCYLIL